MTDKDTLERFIFENAPIRGVLVRLENSFKTIVDQHKYPPVIRQILGELLTAVSLLCANVKFKGRVSIQFQGKDKLKLLIAQCNDQFHLRGLARWEGDIAVTEILELLKNGLLVIMMDPDGEGSKRYQGVVSWQGSSLAESIEGYFQHSEQLPTRIWIAVEGNKAAGLLLQVLPDQIPQLESVFSEDLDWERVNHLTSTLTAGELLNLETKQLLHLLYSEDDIRLFESTPLRFACECSEERSERALKFIGLEEAERELQEKQKIVVTCEFCGHEYTFDRVDVARIFKGGDGPESSTRMQ